MKEKVSIVLTGVGGQGVITAAKIIGEAALNEDIQVYVSEVHGMAQRGGSVICTVRMGKVSTALLARGTADAIISTEPIEALRYIGFANKQTKVITDINPIVPFNVTVSGEKYPNLEDVFKEIKSYANLYKIDALKIARKAGSIITKNIVMLGSLAAVDVLPFKSDVLLESIIKNIPDNYKEINKKAFYGGMKAIKT
jgi:indolepyruvate ferredoxin oxidoreductase beta subunit